MWCVYILECADQSLYVGITNDLKRRSEEHFTKKGGWYTSYKSAVKIVYSEERLNKYQAAKREKQIKGWTRKKKLALIRGDLLLLKKL